MTPPARPALPRAGELCGDVVRLTPIALEDVDGLLAAATEDRSTYGWTAVPADAAAVRAYVELALAERDAGVSLPLTLRWRESGRVIGTTRYLDLEHWRLPGEAVAEDRPSVAEIGSTWLAASAQRTAGNTEAKLLLLRHAFEGWGAYRVSLKTDARNARSRAAIGRLGAVFEGVRRVHKLASDGTARDSALYSITREEWPAVERALRARLAR